MDTALRVHLHFTQAGLGWAGLGRAGLGWHAEYMLVRDTGRCPEATDTKLDNVPSQAVRDHVPSEHVGCVHVRMLQSCIDTRNFV